MNKSDKNEECAEWCNKMLRGERSAVETYGQAIEKHGTDPRLAELRGIQEEHRRAIADLEGALREMGSEIDETSGAWGVFAKTVQGAANLFGEESAVEALTRGEKKGLDDYEDAIKSGELMPNHRAMYETKLIPRIKGHLMILERMEERVD